MVGLGRVSPGLDYFIMRKKKMKLGELLDILDEKNVRIIEEDGYIFFENKKLIPEELRDREVEKLKFGMFYITECVVIYLVGSKPETENLSKDVVNYMREHDDD